MSDIPENYYSIQELEKIFPAVKKVKTVQDGKEIEVFSVQLFPDSDIFMDILPPIKITDLGK